MVLSYPTISSPIVYYLIGLICFAGCRRQESKLDIIKSHETGSKHLEEIPTSSGVADTYYSDSTIADLSSPETAAVIDTFFALHTFDRDKFQYEECTTFTVDLLIELDEYGIYTGERKTIPYPKVSSLQHQLLGVTEYLCDKTVDSTYNTYVFHVGGGKSHHSNSIQVLTISQHATKTQRLVLAQQYFSEGYEYDISSRFITTTKVEVSKAERFKTSTTASTFDSIRHTLQTYIIGKEGTITEI